LVAEAADSDAGATVVTEVDMAGGSAEAADATGVLVVRAATAGFFLIRFVAGGLTAAARSST